MSEYGFFKGDILLPVFQEALVKMGKGEKKYGKFDPKRDRRDLIEEAIEELLDGINYLAMEIIRLRETRKKVS